MSVKGKRRDVYALQKLARSGARIDLRHSDLGIHWSIRFNIARLRAPSASELYVVLAETVCAHGNTDASGKSLPLKIGMR